MIWKWIIRLGTWLAVRKAKKILKKRARQAHAAAQDYDGLAI